MADESDIDVSISFRWTSSPQPEPSWPRKPTATARRRSRRLPSRRSRPGPSTSRSGRRARPGTPWWTRRIVFGARTARHSQARKWTCATRRSSLRAERGAQRNERNPRARGHPTTSSTLDAVSRTLAALPADDIAPGRLTKPLVARRLRALLRRQARCARRGLTDARPAPERTGAARHRARSVPRNRRFARLKARSRRRNRSPPVTPARRTSGSGARRGGERSGRSAEGGRQSRGARRRGPNGARRSRGDRPGRRARALTDATVARDRAERRPQDIAE